jgi:hypothetical protein
MIEGQQRQFSQSFPGLFKFSGNYYETWQRLGNSVPPLMMFFIARHVRAEILGMHKFASQGAVSANSGYCGLTFQLPG